MKIDNLPETEVTVEAIPDPRDTEITLIDPEQTSDKETSDEEKERIEKFMRSAFIRKNVFTLKQINNRCIKNNLTLEDLRNEIENKKSPLSRMQRDFLCTYKLDFIQECIIDLIDAQKRAIEYRYAVQS